MKVAILGATGETGGSVTNGLLEQPDKFEITALVRPSSLEKKEVADLKSRGVKIAPVDLTPKSGGTPQSEVVDLLKGHDVVISCVLPTSHEEQLRLVEACKAAGVGRFVPSFFGPIVPARGILLLRDEKEDLLDHIKKLYVPYTAIDVGWWMQIALPRLPSGRIDRAVTLPPTTIAGDGNTETTLTDLRDVGRFVARIIQDPRTLNQKVFAYGETGWTQNKIWDLLEEKSGEKVERKYVPGEEIQAEIDAGLAAVKDTGDINGLLRVVQPQYQMTWGIRGDNTLEHAKYLGYLDARELYPDLAPRKFEDFVDEVLQDKITRPYEGRVWA